MQKMLEKGMKDNMQAIKFCDGAMPVVGVLEQKGVKSHGEGEGVYSND
jgi:hypothetical protein